jgi:hypothetical protein
VSDRDITVPRASGRAVPPIAISETSTLVNPTGSWKYILPRYEDRVAPCNAACPIGIDIEGYMVLIGHGRLEEACDLLVSENPMPAITGRVCHHPCEDGCNRASIDQPVSIHAVERRLGDMILAAPPPPVPDRRRSETVAVIGSGPAGLGCAFFLTRLGYGVTVFEAAAAAGGMLRLGIPEYRLPRAILDRQIERLEAAGIEIRTSVRIGTDVPWRDLDRFDAVFVAPGAHLDKDSRIEGADATEGIRPGLEFLKAVNAGERPDLCRHRRVSTHARGDAGDSPGSEGSQDGRGRIRVPGGAHCSDDEERTPPRNRVPAHGARSARRVRATEAGADGRGKVLGHGRYGSHGDR